jgi:hypothetical protein
MFNHVHRCSHCSWISPWPRCWCFVAQGTKSICHVWPRLLKSCFDSWQCWDSTTPFFSPEEHALKMACNWDERALCEKEDLPSILATSRIYINCIKLPHWPAGNHLKSVYVFVYLSTWDRVTFPLLNGLAPWLPEWCHAQWFRPGTRGHMAIAPRVHRGFGLGGKHAESTHQGGAP